LSIRIDLKMMFLVDKIHKLGYVCLFYTFFGRYPKRFSHFYPFSYAEEFFTSYYVIAKIRFA